MTGGREVFTNNSMGGGGRGGGGEGVFSLARISASSLLECVVSNGYYEVCAVQHSVHSMVLNA